MDPVNILPAEVLDEVWCKLSFADILSCMSVSRSWYESISDSAKLWRPLCIETALINANSWKSIYMKEAKLRWSWRKGLFPENTVIKLIDEYKILSCSEDYIYVIDTNNKLWKYDKTAVNLASIQLDSNCVNMCTIANKIIVLLTSNTVWNDLVFYNELFQEKTRIRVRKENKIHKFDDRLWTWEYRDNAYNSDKMSVYCVKNLKQIEQVNIPFGATVMSLRPGWCILNRGEVWWLNGNNQTKLYASYISPMARPCVDILTNNKDKVVILDTKRILEHPFSTVLIYCNGIREHRTDVMETVIQMCFSGGLLILRTTTNIFTIDIDTGAQQEFDCLWESIYSVHNLLEHSKLAWILIKQNYEVLIYDANNVKCLTSIRFSTKTENLIFSNKMLILPESKVKLIVKSLEL